MQFCADSRSSVHPGVCYGVLAKDMIQGQYLLADPDKMTSNPNTVTLTLEENDTWVSYFL